MIDRIKIKVECPLPVNPQSFYLTPAKNINDYWDYYLANEDKEHFLKIKNHVDHFLIDGSIRKWYLGKDSLHDLTLIQIVEACYKIASRLGINPWYIFESRILIIEIGKNIHVSTGCSAIIGKIYGYSRFERVPRENVYVSFRSKTSGQHFTFYDKGQEVNGKTMKPNSENILRVEIRCFRFAAIKAKCCNAEKLIDVIERYQMVITSLMREAKRIEMKPVLMGIDDVAFAGKGVRYFKSYLLARGMRVVGERKVKMLLKRIGIASSNVSSQNKKLRAIQQQFRRKGVYGKYELLAEIRQPLAAEISRSPYKIVRKLLYLIN